MLWVLGKNGTINLKPDGLLSQPVQLLLHRRGAAYGLALVVGRCSTSAPRCREADRRRKAGVPFRPMLDIVAAHGGCWRSWPSPSRPCSTRTEGLPLALVIFLVVVVGFDFVLRRTAYGRQIFAVGGGIEAARRAGINVAVDPDLGLHDLRHAAPRSAACSWPAQIDSAQTSARAAATP